MKRTVIAVVLTVLLAGCQGATRASSGPASPSPKASPSPNASLCTDAAALRTSLSQLTDLTIAPGLVDEVRTDLDAVAAALSQFIGDARGQWQAQTGVLTSALAGLRTSLSDLTASPGTAGLRGVQSAYVQVQTAARDLLSAIGPACPSPSPSG